MGQKTITVTGVENYVIDQESTSGGLKTATLSGKDIQVSDGYHTMKEVYQHRMVLFAALLKMMKYHVAAPLVWKSKHHSDCVASNPFITLEGGPLPRGTDVRDGPCCSMFEGMFICGIGLEKGRQITYHLPIEMFDDLKVRERIRAPEYDGHTAADVLERLKRL